MNPSPYPVHGLRANWVRFAILVLENAFVGGMLGIERSLVPVLGTTIYHLNAYTAVMTFILVFGAGKALANLAAGILAHRFGRKKVLLLGWLAAFPVPAMLMLAPDWNWIIAANLLLGIHQGFAWSSTVVMKMDLVHDHEQGLAMGLNEFAGYLAIGFFAWLSTWLSSHFGLYPWPFYANGLVMIAGILTAIFLVRDTQVHIRAAATANNKPLIKNIFRTVTWENPTLSAITQAGLINNLNDGMIWGLLPLFLAARGLSSVEMGWVVAVYPAVWGLSQVFTGSLSDRYSNRSLIAGGMILQGVLIGLFLLSHSIELFLFLVTGIGIGTALVYPTFLAAISREVHPQDRAKVVGTFRFWRDSGYVFGALLSGGIADWFGLEWAIFAVSGITLLSGGIVWIRMPASR